MTHNIPKQDQIRVYCFKEFKGIIPRPIENVCKDFMMNYNFNMSDSPLSSISTNKEINDVLHTNVKVFWDIIDPYRVQVIVPCIQSLFEKHNYKVYRLRDRLICVANTDINQNCSSINDVGANDIITKPPKRMVIDTSTSNKINLSASATCLLSVGSTIGGISFGERLEPVDDTERQVYVDNPHYQIQHGEEHICIGSYFSLCDPVALRNHKITHAINASQRTSVVARRAGIKVLDIDLVDRSTSNLIEHLVLCREFIDECLKSGGTVLIGCFAGVSRSASIFIDFWMYRDGLTFKQARDKLRDVRTCIKPNAGFRQQLELGLFPPRKHKEGKKQFRKQDLK